MQNFNNSVQFTGRLGSDPEFHKFAKGKMVMNINLAINCGYRKGDEWIDKTLWKRGKKFINPDYANRYKEMKKGDLISIMGRLEPNIYTNKEGKAVNEDYVMIGNIKKARTTAPKKEMAAAVTPQPSQTAPSNSEDDDLPF